MELAGLKTSTLAFDTRASIMENELRKLSPKFENVTVSRSTKTSAGGYHWTITFNGIRGDIQVMKPEYTRLEGWDSKVIVDAGKPWQ